MTHEKRPPVEPFEKPIVFPSCPRDGSTLWRKDGKHYCLECGTEYEYTQFSIKEINKHADQ